MGSHLIDLNYEQRLALGRIRARQQFGDEAREKAMKAAQEGDMMASFGYHAEADQHSQAILDACMTIARAV